MRVDFALSRCVVEIISLISVHVNYSVWLTLECNYTSSASNLQAGA